MPAPQQSGVYGGWVHPPSSASPCSNMRQTPSGAPRAQPEVVGDDVFLSKPSSVALPGQEDYLEPRDKSLDPEFDQRESGKHKSIFSMKEPFMFFV